MTCCDFSISYSESRAGVRSGLANVATIAGRELRDSLRSRWFILYTIAFAAMGTGVSYISAAAVSGSGLAGFGRTSAGLINLVLLMVPLMSLTAGAGTIVSDFERGMLLYLLAQPISRWELVIGKYIGLATTLITSICAGFGVCALVLSGQEETLRPSAMALLVGLTILLALAMLSVGLVVSALSRKTSVAVGTSVFIWLVFVFISDLGMMAATLAMRLRIETLFGVAVVNPLQVFKFWSLQTVGASLDVLGPAGLYAQDTFSNWLVGIYAAVLVAWIIIPLAATVCVFSRRSPA